MTDTTILKYRRSDRRAGGFYYGWINLWVAALAMVATLPGRTQGLGLVTEPLLRDLSVTHVDFALINLIATLIGSSFCLACGPLIDRLGARAVLTFIAAALGISVIATSHVHTALPLLITLTLTRGFGQSALSVVSITIVGKWFVRKIPVAMGVYSILIGIGFVAAFPTVGYAAINIGWRPVWDWMGWIIAIGLTAIARLLVRDTPESVGLKVDGEARTAQSPESTPTTQVGLTLAQALRSPAFWAFALAGLAFSLVSSGLMLFNEAVLTEHGMDSHTVINVLAVVTLLGMAANLLGGWLANRWPIGRLMAAAMFLLAAALIALPLAHGRPMAYLYAITMGTAAGVVTVVFFVCWAKVFGRKHLGAIQGAAQLLTVLASAAGPWLLAETTRRTGSSTPLLFALGPVVALLGAFCLFVPLPSLPTE